MNTSIGPYLEGPTDEDLVNMSPKKIGGQKRTFAEKNGRRIIRDYIFLAVKDMEKTRKFKVGNEEIVNSLATLPL